MLRERLSEMLRQASEAGSERVLATLRLIMAAIKERDHVARADGRADGISDDEILTMLGTMVQQRRDEIRRCEACARLDRAEQEAEEIDIIERLLPPQLATGEVEDAISHIIDEIGARKQKDTGRVMTELKSRYPGRMDLAKARRMVQGRLMR